MRCLIWWMKKYYLRFLGWEEDYQSEIEPLLIAFLSESFLSLHQGVLPLLIHLIYQIQTLFLNYELRNSP